VHSEQSGVEERAAVSEDADGGMGAWRCSGGCRARNGAGEREGVRRRGLLELGEGVWMCVE
jgi:hypothetical protein